MFARRTAPPCPAGLRAACCLGGLLATWLAAGPAAAVAGAQPVPAIRPHQPAAAPVTAPAVAVTPVPPAAPAAPGQPGAASPAAPADQLPQLLTSIVREHIPCEYEQRDNWGHTTEVWDGLQIKRDGLQVKTRSRKKSVNDGTWKRYQIQLVDPNQQFHVNVANVRAAPGGRAELDVEVEAALHLTGRIAQWERGLQLFSISAEADARVRLRVSAAWACNWTSASCRPMSSSTRE